MGRHNDQTRAMALTLVEELCALTSMPAPPVPAAAGTPPRQVDLSRR